MKKIRFYMGFILVLLFVVGCSNSKPKPQPVVEHIAPKILKKEEKIVRTSDFLSQNFIKEDRYTKVFQNCFKTGRITLAKSCKKKLQLLLQKTPLKYKREIIIEVHTDMGGTSKKNLSISQKRALSTAASLYYKDYKYSQVYYSGFGEAKPIYNSRSKKADVENRRLVVKLREKNYEIDKKVFKRYIRTRKKTVQKVKVRVKKVAVVKHTVPVNILRYTGKADTGWMYFGDSSLKEKFLISCVDDKPRKVRRKAISKSKKGEFMSGFYSKRITGDFGKNYVEIYPVYLYENGSLPKSNPVVTIYGDDRKVQRLQTTVNSYRGKKGILYRIFMNGKKSIKCMDLVIPYGTKKVSYGRVYSKKESKIKETKFIAE